MDIAVADKKRTATRATMSRRREIAVWIIDLSDERFLPLAGLKRSYTFKRKLILQHLRKLRNFLRQTTRRDDGEDRDATGGSMARMSPRRKPKDFRPTSAFEMRNQTLPRYGLGEIDGEVDRHVLSTRKPSAGRRGKTHGQPDEARRAHELGR